jgi:hypothetical protein
MSNGLDSFELRTKPPAEEISAMWRASHCGRAPSNSLQTPFLPMEALLQRKAFPSNLSLDDRRMYRRWTGGLFASYLTAIIFAVGITYFNFNKLSADPSTPQMARLKPASASTVLPRAASVVRQ